MSESRRTSTVFSLQHCVCQGHERGVVGYASPAAVHSSPPLTTASSLSMLPQPRSPRYLLLPDWPDDKQQTRRLCAWISRKLRPLRAHALIPKIVGTHRYQLTSNGCGIIVAMLMRYAPRLPQFTPVIQPNEPRSPHRRDVRRYPCRSRRRISSIHGDAFQLQGAPVAAQFEVVAIEFEFTKMQPG